MNAINRRSLLAGMAALAASSRLTAAEPANPPGFETLPLALERLDDGKVEVVEFFWYGCPHCYSLEPGMEKWLAERKSDMAVFRREAPALNPSWETHARAFYAAQLMGVEEQMHVALFDKIHQERNRMDSDSALANFADSLDIDGGKLVSTMKSFAVDGKLRASQGLAAKFRLTGVPSVVVGGKYKTSASIAGGFDAMFTAIDNLIVELTA